MHCGDRQAEADLAERLEQAKELEQQLEQDRQEADNREADYA
jgi:hypothetical protein